MHTDLRGDSRVRQPHWCPSAPARSRIHTHTQERSDVRPPEAVERVYERVLLGEAAVRDCP